MDSPAIPLESLKKEKNLWHTEPYFSFILMADVLLLLCPKIIFSLSPLEKKSTSMFPAFILALGLCQSL